MKRGLILVEGRTEEAFVRRVLNPHLETFGLALAPTLLVTKRVIGGPQHKGGVTSFPKATADLRRLLGDSGVAVVTTMLDYYGLPTDFPGMSTRPQQDHVARVEHVEEAWRASVDDGRFLPHVMLHEFEALLFADPDKLPPGFFPPSVRAGMRDVLASHGDDPERINEKRETSPSHRLQAIHKAYDKVVFGVDGAQEVGLSTLRARCRHFSRWLTTLEERAA